MARRDFFQRQDEARRHTALLVIGFLAAVIGVVVAVNLVIWALVASPFLETESAPPTLGEWLRSPMAAWTAGITAGVIGVGTLVRSVQLAHGGGGRVATLMGGRIIDPATKDAGERRLINVVEEMSIASGIPPPDVYVLDHESGINAFAAGMVPANAALAFTAGALEKLDRDELQGVVAHEFSHVANGDMRINVRLLALLAGVTLIGELGASTWRGLFMRRAMGHGMGRRRSPAIGVSRGGGGRGGGDVRGVLVILVVGLALMIIGWIGVFIGRIIKAAISRQREFLADAAAVQFTRNPAGIAGALIKIGSERNGGMLLAGRAEEISHMGFTRTVGGLTGLTATHPPLEERLRAIGPQYVHQYRQALRAQNRESKRERRRREREQAKSQQNQERTGSHGSSGGPLGPLGDLVPDALDAATPGHVGSLLSIAAIGALAGNPGATRLDVARALLAKMPPTVYDALHQPDTARRLIWALLLREPEYIDKLPATEGNPTLELRSQLESAWGDGSGNLQPQMRLPLLELALPALRHLDAEGRRNLLERLDDLIRADGRLAIHEYALRTVLIHHLFERDRPAIGAAGLDRHHDAAHCVLSVLCRAVQGDADTRQHAWQAALQALGETTDANGAEPESMDESDAEDSANPPDAASLREFSAALERLSGLQPSARRDFLAACVACVTTNGHITATEAELLRAIAAVLDTPIPPLEPD